MLMAVIHIPVALHAEATPEQMTVAAYHELGHCLGLDDDQAPESIMHGRIDENLDFDARLRVTDKDKELLRDAYRQVPPPLGHGF
jgi:predicted Zn-dependent protease